MGMAEPCASGWACALGQALALGRLNYVTQVRVIDVTQVPLPLDSSRNKSSSSLLPTRKDTSTSRPGTYTVRPGFPHHLPAQSVVKLAFENIELLSFSGDKLPGQVMEHKNQNS